jgi:hypothetical protein
MLSLIGGADLQLHALQLFERAAGRLHFLLGGFLIALHLLEAFRQTIEITGGGFERSLEGLGSFEGGCERRFGFLWPLFGMVLLSLWVESAGESTDGLMEGS